MFQQQVYIINTVMMVLDALCIYIAGYGAFYIRYFRYDGLWQMDDYAFTVPLVITVFLNNYIMGNLGLYGDRRPPSVPVLVWTVFKAIAIDFMALSAIIFFYRRFGYSREFLLLFGMLSFLLISLLRIAERWYIHNVSKSFNARRILIAGNTEKGEIVRNLLEQQLSWGHEVVGRLTIRKEENMSADDVLGNIENLPTVLRDHAIDEVIFALSDEDRAVGLSGYLELCKKIGITVKILPSLWKPNDRVVSVEIYQKVPFLTIKTDNFNATGLLYKRILDLVGGLVGTLLFLIMYPFIAVAIKRDSEGPVIFKQKRVGQNGRIFHLYKFRTMYIDAEQRKQELLKQNEMQGFIFKLKDDPRITPLGKWLRKTSLDEFPQFLNVLKGEMSLVGTRPPTLDEVEKYEPQHLKRISAKPGITGLWQVSGRNVITDFNEIVKLDCKYLDDWRFFDDIKILLKTILVVMQRRGAI